MSISFEPSRFGVKFWLVSAALTSLLAFFNSVMLTIHARAQHGDFWAINGVSRLMAILLIWGAVTSNYRLTRNEATKLTASEDVLLSIQFSNAFTLSLACAAMLMILNAAGK